MREIKFRAWIQSAKKMILVDSIEFHIDIDNKLWYLSTQWDRSDPNFLFERRPKLGGTFPLMQFIGLKDKNGKEIYEGDVLGWKAREFDYNKAQVVFDDKALRFVAELLPDGCGEDIRDLMRTDNAKVIGNIYENPELVK